MAEARIRVLEGEKTRLQEQVTVLQNKAQADKRGSDALYQIEYDRREKLAGLIGKFTQNVTEFQRVFQQILSA